MKAPLKYRLKIKNLTLILFEKLKPIGKYFPARVKLVFSRFVFIPLVYSRKFLKVSYGKKNNDKYFLVIGGHSAGLYSIIHNVLGYLIYAEKNGYIPVVDYKSNKTYYHSTVESLNLWEEYFEQPSEYSLDEVYSSKNVIHTPLGFTDDYPINFEHITYSNFILIDKFNGIFNNEISYNKTTKEHIESLYSEINHLELIGVYLRGSDYKDAKGHHIQPSNQIIFDKIDEFLIKYNNINGIFLSTEEEETLNLYIEKYGKLVYYQNRPRIKGYLTGQITPDISFDGVTDKIRIGREYLADIEILSRLNYFICGISNGSAAVIEKNGLNFIDYFVFFKGLN